MNRRPNCLHRYNQYSGEMLAVGLQSEVEQEKTHPVAAKDFGNLVSSLQVWYLMFGQTYWPQLVEGSLDSGLS